MTTPQAQGDFVGINAIMKELLNAQKTGSIGKAQELAIAVLGWINRGRVAPHGFTIG